MARESKGSRNHARRAVPVSSAAAEPASKLDRKYWFWVCLLQMTVVKSRSHDPKAMTEVWENIKIVNANSPSEAYQKALKLGRAESGDCGGSLRLFGEPAVARCIGVSSMGLIHDNLVDGAEITWTLFRRRKSNAVAMATPRKRLLAEVNREQGRQGQRFTIYRRRERHDRRARSGTA